MSDCPYAIEATPLKTGDRAVKCRLVTTMTGYDAIVSERKVCTICVSQWTSGPPRQLTPVLQGIYPSKGLGDWIAAAIRKSRLDSLAYRLGLYEPSTCGCAARRAAANALVPARQLRQCFHARYRLPLPE